MNVNVQKQESSEQYSIPYPSRDRKYSAAEVAAWLSSFSTSQSISEKTPWINDSPSAFRSRLRVQAVPHDDYPMTRWRQEYTRMNSRVWGFIETVSARLTEISPKCDVRIIWAQKWSRRMYRGDDMNQARRWEGSDGGNLANWDDTYLCRLARGMCSDRQLMAEDWV